MRRPVRQLALDLEHALLGRHRARRDRLEPALERIDVGRPDHRVALLCQHREAVAAVGEEAAGGQAIGRGGIDRCQLAAAKNGKGRFQSQRLWTDRGACRRPD